MLSLQFEIFSWCLLQVCLDSIWLGDGLLWIKLAGRLGSYCNMHLIVTENMSIVQFDRDSHFKTPTCFLILTVLVNPGVAVTEAKIKYCLFCMFLLKLLNLCSEKHEIRYFSSILECSALRSDDKVQYVLDLKTTF